MDVPSLSLAEALAYQQFCGAGAGAENRGAEIKWLPGAGAEITNCGSSPSSGSGSFLFITGLKTFY